MGKQVIKKLRNTVFCFSHGTREPIIVGAIWCSECGHQFKSLDDLKQEHIELYENIREQSWASLDEASLESFYQTFCPLCFHDLESYDV